ncbi:uncharacterized protein LOC141915394 [Tubulanus polymorphus]|uniref:uncharacterized protein LOC141915394 n=1 Tax=Tubulanus polymorphus TaxID=672921 RepID=UPI003DA1FEA5
MVKKHSKQMTLDVFCLMVFILISKVKSSALPIENWNNDNEKFISIDEDINDAADTYATMDFNVGDDMVIRELDMIFRKKEWSEIESGTYDHYDYDDYHDYFHDDYRNDENDHAPKSRRNAIKDKRWPDKTVPYMVPNTFDKLDKREIQAAIEDISKYSCVRFREATQSDVNAIIMQNGAGCQSHVGMDGGRQPLYLSKKCRKRRTVTHELMHALGFPHEQNRPDRDNHITIKTKNIKPGKEHNFQRYKIDDIEDSGVEYDYNSLMHYGQRAFSVSEKPTMVTQDKKYQDVIGEATGLSFKDIKEINIRYNCKSHCPEKSCPGGGFVGKDCQCWCRGMSADEPVVHCSSKTAIKDSCRDTVARCPRLANIGYCETRKEYMERTCPKSCGLCSSGLCVDKRSQCRSWKADGYCSKPEHTEFMTENCAKSCNLCKAEKICADLSTGTECKIWRLNGFCKNDEYKTFMQGNCAKTCRFCRDEIQDCVDKVADSCPAWQAAGYCEHTSYKTYMLYHCAKSCSVCKPPPPKPEPVQCKDVNANCDQWKKDGFCTESFYRKYMQKECAATCNLCLMTGKTYILLISVIGLLHVGLYVSADYDSSEEDINQVARSSMTLDQIISNSAETSGAMDFIVDDKTVLVELDILYDKDEWSDIEKSRRDENGSRKKRNAIHDKRWTDKIVPYILSNTFSQGDQNEVKAAMADYEKYTCVQFKEADDNDKSKIVIQNGAGCSSYVGMTGRESQAVNLAKGCRVKGVIMHELGHALGFQHEQTRPDRDEYVTIHKENISPTMTFNFKKYSWTTIKDFSVPYDYRSIMHYGQYAFSTNGQRTIVAMDKKYQDIMGNREGLSFSDIKLVNLMYKCSENCESKTCPGEGYLGKDCRCWCPGTPVKPCPVGSETGTTDATKTVTTTTAATKIRCSDSLSRCASYARYGYCEHEQHKSYMKERCKKSCGFCEDDDSSGGSKSKCVDIQTDCLTWKRQGFCQHSNYKQYMMNNCPKTCSFCNGDDSGTDKTTDKTPTQTCKDAHSRCQQWKSDGYCEESTYTSYMKKNCAKTCAHCASTGGSTVKPTEDPCKDDHSNCPSWAKSEMCDGYYESYMKKYCKKSCQFCKGVEKETDQSCQDQNFNCQSWASRGECSRNPGYMNFYCKKSCGTCGKSDDDLLSGKDCKDIKRFCRVWSRRGECLNKPYYMKFNCKKTCGFCGEDNGTDGTTVTTPMPRPDCVDKQFDCDEWAFRGACYKSPKFMKGSCRKACKLC